jgi:predicted HTH domain antitoxin
LRAALRLYVEMGDIRLASKVAGMGVEEFRELLRRARVPVVV